MDDFTDSSNSDTPALAYFNQAMDAFDRGNNELSEELCRKAAKLYEQAGRDEVSAVYRQLGLIAYWRPDCDGAERWFRKSLEIEGNLTWRNRLTLYARLWRYRFLSFFSK